ncbi:MAG: thiol-disulfide oxidoreductase DCC family protein [Bacteroidota bacterium]
MTERIILFDGVCNLCNNAVQHVIKNDARKLFRFASLQSEFGKQTLQKYKLQANDLSSFILLDNEKLYKKSSGALRVSKYLGGAWPLLYTMIIIPSFIRDAVYSWIARNRYKWFGKQETCWLPTPELKERFIN